MKELKGKNFILRSIKKGDEFDIVKNINDKTISRNTAAIPYPYTLKNAKDWIKECFKKEKNKVVSEMLFIVEIDGEACGAIDICKIERNHKAEIGYWLARKHWGKGIASEMVKLITEFGFKEFKLKRIYAKVYSFNPASKRVLEKNGFKLEGICRKDVKKGNRFFDDYIFANVK